ncbi:MAG: hypothetical protein ACKOZY_07365 [Flavobacteriales bacterium]
MNPSEIALPTSSTWQYPSVADPSFYASNISGAYRLPNNHLIVTHGPNGRIFETDANGNTIWSYMNPISAGAPFSQGDTPVNNRVFKAIWYAEDYPAFATNDLVDDGPLELNTTTDLCTAQSISANVGSEFPYSLHGQSILFKQQGSCLFTDAQGRILAQYTFAPHERISIPAQGFNQWILLHVQTATGMNTQRIFVHD